MQARECFAFCSEYLEVDLNFRDAYLWEPKHQAKESANTWEKCVQPTAFLLWVQRWLALCGPPTLLSTPTPRPDTATHPFLGPEQNHTGQGPFLWQSWKCMMRCFLAFGSSKVWWFTADVSFTTVSSLEGRAYIVCPVSSGEGSGPRARAQDSRQEECHLGCLA